MKRRQFLMNSLATSSLAIAGRGLAQPAVSAVFTPFAQSNEAWRRWMSVVVRTPDSSASPRRRSP